MTGFPLPDFTPGMEVRVQGKRGAYRFQRWVEGKRLSAQLMGPHGFAFVLPERIQRKHHDTIPAQPVGR